MSEESPAYGAPRAVSSVVAERWALDLLRNVADALANPPRSKKADAIRLLGGR